MEKASDDDALFEGRVSCQVSCLGRLHSPKVSGQVLLMYCGLVAADELLPLHGGKDRACKGMTSGTGQAETARFCQQKLFGFMSDYTRQAQKWSAKDLNECKQICTGNCQAVQWVPGTHLCELWNVPVLHTMPEEGAQCYAKNAATKMDALMPQERQNQMVEKRDVFVWMFKQLQVDREER